MKTTSGTAHALGATRRPHHTEIIARISAHNRFDSISRRLDQYHFMTRDEFANLTVGDVILFDSQPRRIATIAHEESMPVRPDVGKDDTGNVHTTTGVPLRGGEAKRAPDGPPKEGKCREGKCPHHGEIAVDPPYAILEPERFAGSRLVRPEEIQRLPQRTSGAAGGSPKRNSLS